MAAKAYKKAIAIIVVIDAIDRDRIVEAREELHERVWLENRRDKYRIRSRRSTTFPIEELSAEAGYDILDDERVMTGLPVLILANKQDLEVLKHSAKLPPPLYAADFCLEPNEPRANSREAQFSG